MHILCQNNHGLTNDTRIFWEKPKMYVFRFYFKKDKPNNLGKYENILIEV